jgi:hypothetical protein
MSDTTAPETPTVDQSTADGAAPEGVESPAVTEGAPALGDAGKKALDAMKAERNEAKAEAKRIADEFAALKAQVEGKQAEFEAQKAAREVEQSALAKANDRIIKAEVKAASAGKLADPLDALKFLDLGSFEVDDDGNVDSSAIAAAIGALIADKPYLAAQGGGRFQGSADGGTRNGTAADRQLSRDDLSRMTPEQISEATDKGLFNDLLSGK